VRQKLDRLVPAADVRVNLKNKFKKFIYFEKLRLLDNFQKNSKINILISYLVKSIFQASANKLQVALWRVSSGTIWVFQIIVLGPRAVRVGLGDSWSRVHAVLVWSNIVDVVV